MGQRFYIDTSIWRDYYENRNDRFRPLGEWALELINDIVENKDLILFSELVVEELGVKYSKEEIKGIFEIINSKNLLLKWMYQIFREKKPLIYVKKEM